MLFTNILAYATALAATVPMVAGLYYWDPKLQTYTLGEVPPRGPKMTGSAANWMGRCNGGDIPEGGYGCGNFGGIGTVIYKCVAYKDDGYWLKRHETCSWADQTGGQCVKNQLKKGAKFYPLVSGSKVVCVQPTDV
jgi:hypothetical protein